MKDISVCRARLLLLVQMFNEVTDEKHPLDTFQILEYLNSKGIETTVKTFRSDIKLLEQLGFDIVTVSGRPNQYFLGERTFELPELKLLIDAVSSSRFITKKKSRELSQKISEQTSIHQRNGLRSNIYAVNRIKTNNESIYYIVDTINDAINKNQRISFKYTEYTPELKKVFRNGGEVYELSPYALLWNDDYYYVIGYSDKHNNISAFRADRLYKPEIIDKESAKCPQGFKLEDYSKQIFEMYGGDAVDVRLVCKNELAKYIVDRFGDELKTKQFSSDSFEVTVKVSLSPTCFLQAQNTESCRAKM